MAELNRKNLLELCGNNIQELIKIDLSGKYIKTINFDTFAGLTELIELNLDYNIIEKLKKGIFDGPSILEELHLYNKLKRVDDSNTFKGLIRLHTLQLKGNSIEEIEERSFESLLNLKELGLTDNKLKRIDSNTFKELTKLETLSLERNQIEEIGMKAFETISNLKVLWFGNNKLKRIEPNIFINLTKLERLRLEHNEIEVIELLSFESLSNLKELNLYCNMLKRIVSNTFKGLKKLETLSLNENQIEEIEERSFESLSNLKKLGLTANKLKRIDSNTFKGLTKLERLRLERNEIEELSKRSFEGLSNLNDLCLNYNQLKLIDRKCFESLSSMKILKLNANNDLMNAFSFVSDGLTFACYNKEELGKLRYISDWNIFLDQFESSEFYNPKLLIVDYYDSLISQIDIYTEELLEKYNENDLLQESSKEKDSFENDIIKNPYKIDYQNDLKINFNLGSTKIIDYLNLVRSKAVEEINKAKDENLERYEMNKEKYKFGRNDLTLEKVQEMKRELFKEKFCFLIKVDKDINKRNLFKLHTVVIDFYLDHYERFLLGNSLYSYYFSKNSFSFKMDNLCSILISSCIYGLSKSYGNEVISIKIESLQKIEHINVVNNNVCGEIDCNFKLSHGFKDLSQLNSIVYRNQNCVNQMVLTNLEYLSISGVYIRKYIFKGLNKLIGLKLNDCKLEDISCYVENLQSLEIIDSEYYKIMCNKFKNLKKLRLCIKIIYIYYLDFLEFESFSKLEYLNLNECKIKDILPGVFSNFKYLKHLEMDYSFYFRPDLFLGLDNLETLIVKRSETNRNRIQLVKGVFNGLSKLTKLDLSLKSLEYIDPKTFIPTPMLTHLRIDGIKCKLHETMFIHLKHLKTIEIDKSDLKQIDSNVLDAFRRSNIEIIIQ